MALEKAVPPEPSVQKARAFYHKAAPGCDPAGGFSLRPLKQKTLACFFSIFSVNPRPGMLTSPPSVQGRDLYSFLARRHQFQENATRPVPLLPAKCLDRTAKLIHVCLRPEPCNVQIESSLRDHAKEKGHFSLHNEPAVLAERQTPAFPDAL